MRKRVVMRFIRTFRKRSFEDAVLWLIAFLVKTYAPEQIDTQKTLLSAVYASCMGITITMAVKQLKRKGYVVHSNRTVLEKIASIDAVTVDKLVKQAREVVLRVARKFGFHQRRTIVSIDFHDKPFYGDRSLKEVVGTKQKAGTNFAYRYATICICEEGMRFNLATMAVTQLNSKRAVILYLLAEARKYVCIAQVLLDRGFHGTETIGLLDSEANTYYTMPLPANAKLQKIAEDMKGIITLPYTFYESRSEEYHTTVKLIVDKRGEEAHYFITNLPGESKGALLLIIEVYRRRWGIETGYRVADEFYAGTTSTRFSLRCFLALLSFLLQDLWTLSNFIAQKGTPLQQARSKLLKGCRRVVQFLRKIVQELPFYWRPSLEAELFREDIIDAIKRQLA